MRGFALFLHLVAAQAWHVARRAGEYDSDEACVRREDHAFRYRRQDLAEWFKFVQSPGPGTRYRGVVVSC